MFTSRLSRLTNEDVQEDFDMVKQAQKLSGDTRLLADVVDEMRVAGDYDLVSDLFGGKSHAMRPAQWCVKVVTVFVSGAAGGAGGLGEISTMMKNTANFMDKGTAILSKLNQRFGGN